MVVFGVVFLMKVMRMMDKEMHEKVAKALRAEQGVQIALLFGSQASGTALEHSDVDIAVAGDAEFSVDYKITLAASLSRLLNREVDLIDLNATHGTLLCEVLTRGVLLIHRDPALYERLIKRMLAEQEDDTRVASKARLERVQRWSRQTKP